MRERLIAQYLRAVYRSILREGRVSRPGLSAEGALSVMAAYPISGPAEAAKGRTPRPSLGALKLVAQSVGGV
jgi:hypothetical protein